MKAEKITSRIAALDQLLAAVDIECPQDTVFKRLHVDYKEWNGSFRLHADILWPNPDVTTITEHMRVAEAIEKGVQAVLGGELTWYDRRDEYTTSYIWDWCPRPA